MREDRDNVAPMNDIKGPFPGDPTYRSGGNEEAKERDRLVGASRRQMFQPTPAAVPAPEPLIAPRLPTDPKFRKEIPMVTCLLDYFPEALMAVAANSRKATQQHHPDREDHWARQVSTDEANCIVRHLIDRGTIDTDGVRHSTKVAWRALALLQKEIEAANGLPISRGSRP